MVMEQVTASRAFFVLLSVLVVISCGAASGMYWVTSNVVHVEVQYTVVLAVSVRRTLVSLTAEVSLNGAPAGAGVSVDFYYSLNGGAWTYFATQETNPRGTARARYTITASGAYDFQAVVRLP